ncbi:MAG: hypothetical protein ACM3PE_07790 [Deltaproteobacteria bacterium]
MRKITLIALIMLLSVSLFGCGTGTKQGKVNNSPEQAKAADKQAVISHVKGFGKQLSMVSLTAPTDTVAKDMMKYYSSYVSSQLINTWAKDPLKAPGRLTSSPWPDRIEIQSTTRVSADTYKVNGNIIEITSTEKTTGKAAAKRPITLQVKKINNRWLITEATVGNEQAENNALIYTNTQYGFSFSLPATWKGYTIVNSQWQGLAINGPNSGKPVESGPIISIRHPLWTAQQLRQDIPIMIFTTGQWDSLEKENFHIGAAPIGPSELAHNSRYVFALPARYNFAFPTGFEEVERILAAKPLKPIK